MVELDEIDFLWVEEGQVRIKIPQFEKVTARAPVFFNPVMELNRDLSVTVLSFYQKQKGEDIAICDAFGGSGIRGIRYAQEIKNVSLAVVNDLNPLAVKLANENIQSNGLTNVKACREDANLILRKYRGKFDVIDIDPFGTPAPYVESAAASLKAGGLICITATDTSALCGTYKKPCIRKYGAKPLRNEYCHETGLRILAGFMSRTFSKYKKYLNFQFSHSTEHYMRLYALVGKGAKNTDDSLEDLGYIAHCPKCLNRQVFKGLAPKISGECPECGEDFQVAGPLWCGEIQNSEFIQGMLDLVPDLKINREGEVIKLLEKCEEEAGAPPTFYDMHAICKKLKISASPREMVMENIRKKGYQVKLTHFNPNGLKTDAPLSVIEQAIKNEE
ncbi:MAG: tRNA (guanine26-N2/guanine27-N2)-dimethyltransferase [Methanobacterium sp.]|jgi:tRNA (guanine26-N2/guanine27-N2)-dimethyltransferase|uniref:tRNA (guanine(10)-N(2))-dimethyltransferase n=1 Tax=Methanobacterium sp. TaxID=2164 RepID=UPI0003C9C168|nr:tRNA (guanine(10)-N(2))-dimethyltransferase [Methanobacterium sp.]MDI3549729.1 tRNA (guanine26-N2/guanine27-N2)-dimethyltransferase [Methanobacterium sp.]CDG65800.1 tRNA (guanine(26)-N(2))-dimethyltransferase [Methanobacterium sp. MB1]